MSRFAIAVAWLIAGLSASFSAQGLRLEHKSSYVTPRTPWGHPDLQGRWTNATVTPLERPTDLGDKEFFTEAEAAEYSKIALERFLVSIDSTKENEISGEYVDDGWGEARTIVPTLRTSLIVGPTGRLPALTPEGRARTAALAAARKADLAESPEERTLGERCLWFLPEGPPMLPGVTYNSNYEIVQTPTHVAIQIEMGNGFRIIPLDGRPHQPPHVRSWLGDSRGRWEGDTLVVETTNFTEKRNVRGSSDGLRLVERFRRTRDDVILYEFTATDPSTWASPWSGEVPMRKMDGLLYEYACHEGNYTLGNVMRAARAAEKAASR
jgi:hypothetical protein